jgi:hypothetical protein
MHRFMRLTWQGRLCVRLSPQKQPLAHRLQVELPASWSERRKMLLAVLQPGIGCCGAQPARLPKICTTGRATHHTAPERSYGYARIL